MAAPVNYAELYLQALQQKFNAGLSFSALFNSPNNSRIRFINAKTISIPRITVGGFTDVDRDVVGNYTRRAENDFETKTIEHDREFRTLVDPVDIDESNLALSIANITNVFNDEQKIPEMDKYVISKLLAERQRVGGGVTEGDVTAENVLSIFDDMMMEMDDAEVPQEGRMLYITPQINKVIKQAQEIQRKLDVGGTGANAVNRSIYSLEDVNLVVVPSARMKDSYVFTEGAVPAPGAKQIHMALVNPAAVITPQKYEFVSLDAPSATTGGKYLYYERKYWDLFLIDKKAPAVAFHIEPTATAPAE